MLNNAYAQRVPALDRSPPARFDHPRRYPARDILDRRRALDVGERAWTDRHQHLQLAIHTSTGDRARELDLYERKYPGASPDQKSIIFFLAPAEIKGTAFLSWQNPGKPADQWLYLPELKRTRQITSSLRDQSFVGTDFTPHDLDLIAEMPSWTEADATSSLDGTEVVDGTRCSKITQTPVRKDIGYKRVITWLAEGDLVPRRLEFYDDSGIKKRIELSDLKTIGKVPVAHRIVVTTPAAGSSTTITVTEVQFNQSLEDELFTQQALERGGR